MTLPAYAHVAPAHAYPLRVLARDLVPNQVGGYPHYLLLVCPICGDARAPTTSLPLRVDAELTGDIPAWQGRGPLRTVEVQGACGHTWQVGYGLTHDVPVLLVRALPPAVGAYPARRLTPATVARWPALARLAAWGRTPFLTPTEFAVVVFAAGVGYWLVRVLAGA